MFLLREIKLDATFEENMIRLIAGLSRGFYSVYDLGIQIIVIILRNLLNRLEKEIWLDKFIPPIENTR